MKKFSLILASRERTELLKGLLSSVAKTTSDPGSIEVMVGIDTDDQQTQNIKSELESNFSSINLRFFSRERSKWMHRDYINWMFQESSGKYILVLNDDTALTKSGWDTDGYNKLEEYLSDKNDRVVYASTKDNTGDKRCCCFPLFSREACHAAGWVLPDERPNWGADWDVKQIYADPKINRMLELPEIEVQHITHHNGSRKRDHISVNVEKVFQQYRASGPNINAYVAKVEKYIAEHAVKTNNKMLVVYNICELAGRENWTYYLPAVNSIIGQKFDDFKVAISGCKVSPRTKERLRSTFGSGVIYNWVEDVLPLGVTFNHTVRKCFDLYGDFETVTYIDSGVNLGANPNVLKAMWDRYATGKYAMVAHKVDTDMGHDQWKMAPPRDRDFEIPLGRAVNLHLQLFSKEMYDAYDGKILPDIFASDTSESIFTFMCAALGKKWVLCHDQAVRHRQGVDGPSVGFRNKKPLLFRTARNINQICAEGAMCGFGYEECRPVLRHNSIFYNPDETHKEPNKLKEFIRKSCFIEDGDKFYRSINHKLEQDVKAADGQPSSITCVLVSHEKPKFVLEAINSVLEQTYPNWKLVVIDSGKLFDCGHFNGIADKRVSVVRSYETPETRAVKGMAASCLNRVLNEGIESTFVTYLHDDDVLYPHAFESLTDFIKDNPGVMALYSSQDKILLDDNGNVTYLGETLATEKSGACIAGPPMSGRVNYLQFAHRPEVIKFLSGDFWPEEKHHEKYAAEMFMEKVGCLFPILPLDVKTGLARITPLSVFSNGAENG